MLTEEQKKEIVDTAKRIYKKAWEKRRDEGDLVALYETSHDNYLKESCTHISNFICYLAKEKYQVPDDSNEILGGLISFNGYTNSHFINRIYGEHIDASIEQFNVHSSKPDFSPYESYDGIYKDMEKEEFSSSLIEYEINIHEDEECVKWASERIQKMHPKPEERESSSFGFFKRIFKGFK